MLQVARIKAEPEHVVEGLRKRNISEPEQVVQQILDVDQTRRSTQLKLDEVLAASNTAAKEIGKLMKAGNKEAAEAAKARTSELKEASKTLTEQLRAAEQELNTLLYNTPNVPHAAVSAGKNSDDNEEIESAGTVPELAEDALPHWELIKKFNLIDFELGNKITGAGFPVYKGKGARLQRALINYFLDRAEEAGYQEVIPPLLVNEESGLGTGQLPDKEGQMYEVTADGLFLIPTAEVPITNIYRNEIVKKEDLPIKHAGYTPCFRREAGNWGAHVRGLNRLHQFDKVEIVQVQHPDKSYETLEEMTAHVRTLLKSLELPYRLLRLCGGDMGFTAALTYDFEVYSAAQEQWLEVSSVSNFETYQSNRLKLRYRDENNKPQLAHTLNGSALALPRILAAILENNQDGEQIHIPEVLRKYTRFDTINV
jgi:seryl-tRNA synthetase